MSFDFIYYMEDVCLDLHVKQIIRSDQQIKEIDF